MDDMSTNATILKICAWVMALLASAPIAVSSARTDVSSNGQSLEQAASDPTASLMSVQIQDIYTGGYHRLDDESGNTVLLRVGVPFKAGGLNNIMRATLPVVTDSPSGKSGLGDLTVFDLIAFDQPWGRWAAGAVMLAPMGADRLSAEKWA